MVKYIAICAFVFLGYLAWSMVPIDRGPGIIADNPPVLTDKTNKEAFTYKEAELQPVGELKGEVRVIKKKRYIFDTMSSFSPLDVLVGWNNLSDQKNLDYLHFELKDRSYDHKPYQLPVTYEEIVDETTLWHLIPSTEEIRSTIGKIRDGHILKIEGVLVHVLDKNGLKWETSTVLSDTRKPNHEIVFVTSLILK